MYTIQNTWDYLQVWNLFDDNRTCDLATWCFVPRDPPQLTGRYIENQSIRLVNRYDRSRDSLLVKAPDS